MEWCDWDMIGVCNSYCLHIIGYEFSHKSAMSHKLLLPDVPCRLIEIKVGAGIV